MQPEHLTVPSTSANYSPETSQPQTATGRPRSGSQRSTTGDTNADLDRRPSIRIRRAPSQQPPPRPRSSNSDSNEPPVFIEGHHVGTGGRSRSNSAPQPLGAGVGSQRRASYMPDVAEEITSPTTGNIQEQIAQLPPADANLDADVEAGDGAQSQVNPAAVSSWRPLRRARTMIGRREETQQQRDDREGAEYESELIDILDLVGKRALPLLHSQLTFPSQIRKSRPCRL
jgi:hypothetical protein